MIKYTISRHNGEYILWKDSKTEHGIASIGIYHGSYLECRNKRKEVLKNARKK